MLRSLIAAASAAGAALTLGGCAAAVPPAAPEGPGPLVRLLRRLLPSRHRRIQPGETLIISADRGWREFNPSVNGLGFVNARRAFGDGSADLPSLLLEQDPDIVFVAMGLNDNFSYATAGTDIRSQIDADLQRLSTGLPDARFVVVEPFWYTDYRPESVEAIIGWVRDAAERIGADYIPGASHWIEGRPELMAPDGLHPNDAGYAVLATRMDKAFQPLGL